MVGNGTAGVSGGDVFFNLTSDSQGNISFAPEWSPQSRGFLGSTAGQLIMTAGSIIPNPLQGAFVAANAARSLSEGDIATAVVKVLPFAIQGLAEGTTLLTDIAGPDFNPISSTPSGMISEALGVPGQIADAVGKATTSMVNAGITGQDVGDALVKSGLTSLVGAGVEGLKEVGGEALDGIKSGLSSLADSVSSGASELADNVSSGLSGLIDNVTSDINTDNVSSIGMTGLPSGLPSDLTQGADLSRLSEDELNNLYGTTVANAVDPSSNSTTPLNVSAAVDPIKTVDLSNLSDDELNSLYGGATTRMPTEAELDRMQSFTNNGKTYFYDTNVQDNPNQPIYVEDSNGSLRIAGDEEFQNALTESGRGVFTTGNDLNTVTIKGKIEPETALTTTPVVDFSQLTNLNQINRVTSQQVAALSSNDIKVISTDATAALKTDATAALKTDDTSALKTDATASLTTNQISGFTSAQIKALTDVGTGLVVGSVLTGSSTKPTTTLTTDTAKTLSTDTVKALSTDTTAALSTDQTSLTSSQVGALTTMDALGLRGIANPALRYWNQTGATGTAGQGGVRFFDWSTNPVPVMGGSNIAAAQALSSVPMLTSSQISALNPAPVQYYNQATNRYYSDPTGKWQPPAGWTRTGLKGGGEVKTKHFDDGGDVSFGYDWAEDPLSELNNLNNIRWGSGYFGTPEEVAQNYGNEGRAYTGENALDPTTSSPINAQSNVAKNIVDRLKGLGAKLGASALKSIENNPGAWLAALAGAGLGYAASKNNTVTPMGLRGLGLSQQQVYNTLKGGNYVGRAVGGEIPGYGMGGGLHYLKSAEDGMADKIPATIDNKQPARLSGGEFVIPADVVSHLGNGNSEAGAKQLYEMMDRIRHARTGTKEQGKQINPSKFTPK